MDANSKLTSRELSLLRPDNRDPESNERSNATPTDESERHSFPLTSGQEAGDPRYSHVRDNLDVLTSFHRDVAGRFADAISRSLQRLVEVELVDVQPITYSQYVYGRESPTCYFVLSASPLSAPLAFELSPAALYPMLDCMLGGGKHACEIPGRAPTMLEQRLARKVLGLLLDELHDAWEPLLAVELAVDRFESQPQRVRVVAPGEHVVALMFEVKVADQVGSMSLCLPERAIAMIVDKLLVANESQSTAVASKCELLVCFDGELIDSHRLPQLNPGDLLHTDIDVDGLVDIEIEGTVVGQGRLASAQGFRAVVIN